ncbi:MAG: dihydrolipoamide dehydrogenase [Candidatus Sumerlaeota bacterium]|nr:dihydrolipoamide dehydrogenase [Candidatus Sumerlaeota bacterium]
MAPTSFDVVVIGGGPGGYVAAIRASQMGLKTAVIDRDRLGGICLNWGCIPTKALLKNAELYDHLKHGAEWGIECDNIRFDFGKIVNRSRRVADKMASGVDFLMKKNKVTPIYGQAKIIAPGKVRVAAPEGNRDIEGKHIIIATGARPRTIPGVQFDSERIISSKEAMFLGECPKTMVVIGAGAIGIEFAYFYAVLGTKVTVLEAQDSILPVEDREVSAVVQKSMKHRGVDIHTGAFVEGVKKTKKGVEVTFKKGKDGKPQSIEADKCLMAIGVQGNIENVGLEQVGIATERSSIKVDRDYKTNVEGFYAIGDVIGPPWLAHVASAEGVICVEAIAGHKPHALDYSNIPGCTYCQPQVASVGLTEEKCKEQKLDYKVGKFPFRASGKAVATGDPDGMVKIIFGAKYHEILGAHIVGAEATEMIGELGLAKSLEATLEDIHGTVHAHPTLSESMMEAAAAAAGIAIHI